ncbi:MAG TPA: 2-phospho-L-lactate transferase [Anaerolineaceae bacterium]|nr:2-phospho-L-lactate transferase [Anaerolineaceae bacterium]
MIPNFEEISKNLKVTALAGGVGGAKLLVGLDKILQPGQLTAIVNTGDDFSHFGLHISPDLDSVCYALAGLADLVHGWGRKDESWQVLEELRRIGAPDWFALGDKDLAWHLERRHLLNEGKTLTEVTAYFCERNGIQSRVLPMSDESAPTLIKTKVGEWLGFQDYFVRLQCQPEIAEIALLGTREVAASGLAIQALTDADLIVLAPSNPWVSIDPILALRGVRNILLQKPLVAVSPIVQGSALKGPAAKMFKDLGIEPSALAVRQHYEDILDGFIFDDLDSEIAENWPPSAIITESFQTIMKDEADKVTLAKAVISLGVRILQGR